VTAATAGADLETGHGRVIAPTAVLDVTAAGFGVRRPSTPDSLHELVDALGGLLEVTFEPNVATTYRLRLPLVCLLTGTAAPTAGRPPASGDHS
jgi:hypothetical protein